MTDTSPPPVSREKNIEAFQALLELDEKERSFEARQGYLKAYALSILFPPVGVYYCIKYVLFSGGTEEARRVGYLSLALTVASFLAGIWVFGLLFSQGSPVNSGNTDMLKELITPANQKALQDLMK